MFFELFLDPLDLSFIGLWLLSEGKTLNIIMILFISIQQIQLFYYKSQISHTPSKHTMQFNKLLRRWLHLQEYQSKELMNKYGLTTQKFKIISNVNEAEKAAHDLSNIKLLNDNINSYICM